MSRVVSVRLSKDLEEKLNLAMKLKRVNKVSEILIEALNIGLDEIIKRERIMEELAREGLTMLIVTHEVGFAEEAANRVMIMNDGRIVEEGPPSVIFTSPKCNFTRRFLNRILTR